MSRIYLNYDDVGNLVKALGKVRINPDADDLECVNFLKNALGTQRIIIHNKLYSQTFYNEADTAPHTGINFTFKNYSDLCDAMTKQDMTALKHTERLEIVASVLGWRADALMHHLKTTTGKLGSNSSLEYNVDYLSLFKKMAGEENTQKWKSILNRGPGLCLVAGELGSGVGHTQIASVLLCGGSLEKIDEGVMVASLSGPNKGVVFAAGLFSPQDARWAIKQAKDHLVIGRFRGVNASDAYNKFQFLSVGSDNPVPNLRAILHQQIGHVRGEWWGKLDIKEYDQPEPTALSGISI